MKYSVILIDDDHGPMDYYVEALRRRGFDVTQIDTTDKAFRWIEDPGSQSPSVFVVDLMLPRGSRLTDVETEGGLRSGLFIAEGIRKRFPDPPIIALTNYNDPDVINLLPKGTKAVAKFEVSPLKFADFVAETIKATTS